MTPRLVRRPPATAPHARWRPTKPPWRRNGRRLSQHAQPLWVRVTLRWKLLRLSLHQMVCPPPAGPRRHPTQQRPTKLNSSAKDRITFQWPPLPSLHVRFTAVSESSGHICSPTEQHVQLAAMVQAALAEALENPPGLLALHTQARTLCFQFTPDPLLSPAARRTLIRALRDRSVSAAWTGTGLLRIRSDQLDLRSGEQHPTDVDRLWVPVLHDKRTTVWWPLFASQHLVLAGAAEGPLTALVQQVQQHIPEHPPLLVHDPDGRLRGLNDVLAALGTHPDALAETRRLQLVRRFAATRTAAHQDSPVPICIVVAPSEELWPDLQPLLIPDSGMQVILVLGDRPPLAALRTVCHQYAVIETPDSRYPPLPDAFRPAALPAARDGQTVAWQHGGQSFWRGRPIGEGV